MARYVVLSFEDNAEAENFVQAFRAGTPTDGGTGELAQLFYGTPADNTSGFKFQGFSGKGEVVGMYMKPTQFCSCDRKRNEGFSQGKKYGLWVHTCGKPVKISHEPLTIASRLTGFGYNLLLSESERVKAYGEGAKNYYKGRS